MNSDYIVNSHQYWDWRFKNDWNQNGGADQSRFFCQLAVEAMPEWLRHLIRGDALTICDWGCAQGDGTDYLMRTIGCDVTGVDFSDVAIKEAKTRYPAINFLCEDWLNETPQLVYDIVFSSNTLEHFDRPWQIFDKLSKFATKFLILLVPYQEYVRHPEHAVTFDAHNIPLAPNSQWMLVQSTVIDATRRIPSYWPGSQIFLLYARHDAVVQQSISIAETGFQVYRSQEKIADISTQAAKDQELHALAQREEDLRQKLDAQASEHAKLVLAQAAKDCQIQGLQLQIDTLMNTLSWRMTAPLRSVRGLQMRVTRRCGDIKRAYQRKGLGYIVKRSAAVLLGRHVILPSPAPAAAPASVRAEIPMPHQMRADIYIFAVIDWHFRIQRPQHLARALAQHGHRVFYLTNHFSDAAHAGYTVEALDDELPLYQVRLNVRGAPPIYYGSPSEAASQQIAAGLRLFGTEVSNHSAVCLVQHAYWARIASRQQADCLVYDCMDDHEGFGNVPPDLMALESWITRRADLVVATSSVLEQRARKENQQVAVVRNAAQYIDFCRRPAIVYVDPQRRRIIGYYGAIAEWFDIDLMRRIAESFPDCLVLLVGADSVGAQTQLMDLPNVLFTGEVPYTTLPYYVHAFDVCLLPFKVLPLTLATNPVKVYEYLGAGRAVVAIDLPELTQFGDLVRTAADHAGFIEALRQTLDADLNDAAAIKRRQDFASGQTWDHRALALDAAIAAVPRPRVSVVVLTYNNMSLTCDCLRSLDACRQGIELEIIVVDNASTDDTPRFLLDWSAGRDDVRVILNQQNTGFAAGNNIGLTTAAGDYLVMLNNDTVVTPGWAWRLIGHLRNEPDIGLIGPLTNNIGNEARVATEYRQLDLMPAEAEKITQPNLGRWFELPTVAFFCTMMPRSTYETCGPLCEDYGVGMFEDDDYCRRVQAAGLRVACAEDVFVHHHLSASFKKLGQERNRALFEKNRAIYEAKWGPWVPHTYRKR